MLISHELAPDANEQCQNACMRMRNNIGRSEDSIQRFQENFMDACLYCAFFFLKEMTYVCVVQLNKCRMQLRRIL